MIAEVDPSLLTPVMQYGFAGMSVILVAVIVWLIRRLLAVLEKTNEIIAANTEAIRDVDHRTAEELNLVRDLREKLLQRPCLLDSQ